MKTKNLWAKIKEKPDLRTPATILREQAALLKENTNSLLFARVDEIKENISMYGFFGTRTKDDSFIGYSGFILNIIAPKMHDYTYEVLRIAYHPLTIYPVFVASDVFLEQEVIKIIECLSEEHFTRILEKVLSSERIEKVITNLVAQSMESSARSEEHFEEDDDEIDPDSEIDE